MFVVMKSHLFFLVLSLLLLETFGRPSPEPETKRENEKLQTEEFSPVIIQQEFFEAADLQSQLDPTEEAVAVNQYENANYYVDQIVGHLKHYLEEEYNPLLKYHLGGGVEWFKLWGLSSITRILDASLQEDGDQLVIDTNLGFDNLNGQAAVNRQLWWLFWFSGKVHADIEDVKLHVKLIVKRAENKVILDSLSVSNWGKIETKITEGNWLGKITNWFPKIITNFLKNNLAEMIKSAVNSVLEEMEFLFR